MNTQTLLAKAEKWFNEDNDVMWRDCSAFIAGLKAAGVSFNDIDKINDLFRKLMGKSMGIEE